jgi:hypothetical protein
MGNFANTKPHAVLIPYPAQGHINPVFKLAKLLHLKGFYITFVNTEYNHKRLLKSRGSNALDGLSDFKFETIPDGLPTVEGDAGDVMQDVPSLSQSIRENFLQPFCQLLDRLNHSHNVPQVTCLVSDCCMSFTIQAAEKFSLPNLLLFPASACSLLNILHFRSFLEKGIIPLKGTSTIMCVHRERFILINCSKITNMCLIIIKVKNFIDLSHLTVTIS